MSQTLVTPAQVRMEGGQFQSDPPAKNRCLFLADVDTLSAFNDETARGLVS